MNHYLIYPKDDPPGVVTWSQDVTRGPLRVHLEWMQPPGSGPFPTVIVHPPAGDTASDMKGVTRDLAEHGYLAVAVDYWRLIDAKFQRSTFVWREQSDPVAALEVVRAQPHADRDRIAALGFSQGGIFSLLMAAQATDVQAVVAYYPVTDFRLWFDTERPLGPRLAFNVIEWYFKRESGAASDAQFEEILRLASPMTYVESIRAPVLLIHGADDTSAPVEESKRLERALRARGREVELIVVPDAGHVFNFKNAEQARRTWDATLDWLEKYLKQPQRADAEASLCSSLLFKEALRREEQGSPLGCDPEEAPPGAGHARASTSNSRNQSGPMNHGLGALLREEQAAPWDATPKQRSQALAMRKPAPRTPETRADQ